MFKQRLTELLGDLRLGVEPGRVLTRLLLELTGIVDRVDGLEDDLATLKQQLAQLKARRTKK